MSSSAARPQKARAETVVVTGASAGVGRATVRRLAQDGCRIGLLARDADRLEETRREVEWMGGQAFAMPTDVADPDEVERAARAVEEALGPIDIWINNAMVTVLSPFEEMGPEEFRRVTEVTYLGTVHGTRAALRRMRPRNHGTIVQVGSALAYRSIPLQSAYCGAKAAVRGFTDALRCELRHQGSDVHLTMVQLPALNTPQFEWCRSRLAGQPQPVPPIFEPEVAARAVVHAARSRRRELWVGTTSVFTILGQRVSPGLMDRYLAATGYDAQIVDGSAEAAPDEVTRPEGNGAQERHREAAARPDEAPVAGAPPVRPGNLYEPVPGRWAARGRFDDRSFEHSPQLRLSMHRKWVALALGATAGIAALLAARS